MHQLFHISIVTLKNTSDGSFREIFKNASTSHALFDRITSKCTFKASLYFNTVGDDSKLPLLYDPTNDSDWWLSRFFLFFFIYRMFF